MFIKNGLLAIGILSGLYVLSLLLLYITGRRTDARAIGGFIPDCIILFKNLIKDDALALRYKVVLIILLGSLISPIDLIPDFIPVAGQLDDAILIALALRYIIRRAGPELATKHWPGPDSSLRLLLKLSGLKSK